jgi:hypothetical protein
MLNHRLIVVGAALAVCNLAGCAGRDEQVAREWQEHDAECRKFGAEPGTPAYENCRVALRAIESMEHATFSPPTPPRWHEAAALEPGRDGDEQRHAERRYGWPAETSCGRIIGAQLMVLKCGLNIPLADLLAGPDR